jgi:site-specific recombinase XerD
MEAKAMIDAMCDYIEELELLGRKPSYIRGIRAAFTDFRHSIGDEDIDVDLVSERQIKGWISDMRGRGLKDVSIKNAASAIKRFFDFMVESPDHSFKKQNPVARIYKKLPHGRIQTRRPFKTTEQIAQMVKSAYIPRDRAILTVLTKTGIRRSELIGLDVSDVDFDDSLLNVMRHYDQSGVMLAGRKNGVESVLPLDAETIRVLKTHITTREPVDGALFLSRNGKRLDGSVVGGIVKSYAESAGLLANGDVITPHYFRAWITYQLTINGCKPEVVQVIRGDVADTMANFYTRELLSFDDVRREYRRSVPVFGL